MSITLTSKRLVFRPFEVSDAPRLALLLNDIEIARWITPMPHPYSLPMAQAHIERMLASGERTLVLEKDGTLIGSIAIGAGFGFWLARSYWGQGLMSEACAVMVADHFAAGAEELTSGYLAGNAASARIHEKLGFKPNGISRVTARALNKEVDRFDLVLTRAAWEARI